MGTIRVGLSGWSYDEFRGDFYPNDLAQSDELSYYAERFDSVEVNGTFYGLTTPTAVRGWRDAVPSDFVFAVKGSRFITHNKKLRDAEGALANFFASGILDLGSRLGPFLWQLPANLHFDAERIDSFLSLLPHDTAAARDLAGRHDDRVEDVSYGPDKNHRVRHVLEVRHDSWLCDDLVSMLRRHGVALAFSHSSEWPYTEEITAGFVYIRLHGPGELYASAYGDDLERWAERIRAWHAAAELDDAQRITDRSPPERKERDVYVYFDNTATGDAPKEAQRLREMLG